MWNNLEALKMTSQVLLFASVGFAIAAAFSTGVRYYVDRRISSISAQLRAESEQEKEAARLEREASLRSQLASAENELKASQLKVEGIERKTAPRTLSQAQKAQLIPALTQCTKKVVNFTSPMGDHEAYAFAMELDAVFKSAGWTSTGVSQAVYVGGQPKGLAMKVPSKISLHPCCVALQQAFSAVGIDFPGEISPGASIDALTVIVGHKE